ncbi:MAG TPA: type II secretion system protein N [Pseudomonas xinjiangensis]|uniref:Type II secretion system protein N n=2 Tax=root TaxID=1 RepID=A0A7V1BN49_9GAMM|nr:type II secretion system protein N [Halopseudomonas xinjiangensis]HEC48038.1 type II secretion system protein N [Halopseudomonas xinjiangensis]
MMQRINRKTTLVVALALFLLSLVWNLPAAFVWKQISGQFPAQVTLQGLSGTLWSGQVRQMKVNGIEQGAVTWDWRPGPLLAGRIALDVVWQPRNSRVEATLKIGASSMVLEDVNGRLDAASMAALNKAPFVLGGSWLLDVPFLELHDLERVGDASGRLVWENAAGGLPQPLPLGHLSADLTGADDWLVFSLSDQGGPLGLDGTARWRPGQPMFIEARLKARADAEAGLAGGLGMLGQADADGWVGWRAQLR